MAAAGLEVVGLDASHDMLMIARNKLEVLPPEVRRRVQLVEGDMRRFAVDRSNVFDPRVQNLAAGTWSMPANRRREFVHPRSGNRVTIKEEFTYDLERQMVGGAFVFRRGQHHDR